MGQWLGRLLWEQDIVKVRVLLTLPRWLALHSTVELGSAKLEYGAIG